MRISRITLVATAVAVAGCGSQSSSSTPTHTAAHVGRPYQLYTHCGIEWAKINGTFWHAAKPLSDGSGNPPSGWGNPFQDGTLTFVSASRARFDSPAGAATFNRTSRQQPPQICS